MNFEELAVFDASLIELKSASISIESICTPQTPRSNSFFFLKNLKFLKSVDWSLDYSQVGVLFSAAFWESLSEDQKQQFHSSFNFLYTVDDVDRAMCSFSKVFYDNKFTHLNLQVDGRQMGTAQIDPDAEISQQVFIGEYCHIEAGVKILAGAVVMPHCHIGEGTIVYPNATLYPYTVIGRRCRIHANVTIGGDGFGFNHFDGVHNKIWHFSGVKIGNDVEIGTSSIIHCGAFTPTKIGDGTKLDGQCYIAHNSTIGRHCVLCGRASTAGSCDIGDYCVFGADAGCANGVTLGKGCQLAARTTVSENQSWPDGTILGGTPARELKKWLREQAILKRLAKERAS